MDMAKKPTIREVAKAARVSVATVSRVLNGQQGFSSQTERQVRQVVKEMGYSGGGLARAVKNKVPKTIALIVPEVSEYFCGSLAQGIEDAARRRGYVVILCNTGADAMYGESYVEMLRQQYVDGVIACSIPPDSPLNRKIRETGIPCVLLDSISYDCPFPYVKIDDFQGMYTATKYLLDRGHRRIEILSGNVKDPVAGWPRLEGYRQALRDAGVELDPELEAFANHFNYESGKTAFEELLSRNSSFTGIVTCSDMVAAAVLSSAGKLGIRVPEELSVVGFDDSQIASVMNPPLTSVAQPYREMGKAAVDILLKELDGATMVGSRVLPVQVVERESTRSLE